MNLTAFNPMVRLFGPMTPKVMTLMEQADRSEPWQAVNLLADALPKIEFFNRPGATRLARNMQHWASLMKTDEVLEPTRPSNASLLMEIFYWLHRLLPGEKDLRYDVGHKLTAALVNQGVSQQHVLDTIMPQLYKRPESFVEGLRARYGLQWR